MRGASKKMFISILTSVIVFVTMVATTFAWVGIFTYANTDVFQLNLKTVDLDSNYYLTISSSGLRGTFSDNIPSIELERQIVDKFYPQFSDKSDDVIHALYAQTSILPSTTRIENNDLTEFEEVNFGNTTGLTFKKSVGYYDFDIFLSVDTREGITSDSTGIKANVLISNISNMLTGTICSSYFINDNPFSTLPSSDANDVLKEIPDYYRINSKNVSRIAFSLYDPISIDESYSDEEPIKTIIYNGGSELPSYDAINDTYDLGGCLPEDQNTALKELEIIHPSYFDEWSIDNLRTRLEIARNREDLQLVDENNSVWKKSEHTSYLGVMNGIQTKMKIRVRFWFEGWDADCMRAIVEQPVNINLAFTAGKEDE